VRHNIEEIILTDAAL